MKRFFKSMLLFIPFSVLIYLVLIIVVSNIPFQFLKPNISYRIGVSGYMYSRLNEIENFRNIDILFLGSSHTYRGFDTRIFEEHGLRTFNFGSSNQSPIQTEVLLLRYLDELNPKMIILEVSPDIFSSDGVESSVDIIANDKNDFLTLTKLVKWDNIKTVNTAIVGFFRNMLNRDNDFIDSKKKNDDIYIHGGFVEKELKFYKPVKQEKEDILLNGKQLAAFDRIVRMIRSDSIQLFLVQTPITKSEYNSYSNTREFDSLMVKYGAYYNYNLLFNLNDSLHFYDSHHLNQNGVKIFDEDIIRLLQLDSSE